ncbi:MAG: Com family DNA-binding transcriptional regulator [Methylophilus sp.]
MNNTKKQFKTADLRCIKCSKKLAEGVAVKLSIKCPRCGVINKYGENNERTTS